MSRCRARVLQLPRRRQSLNSLVVFTAGCWFAANRNQAGQTTGRSGDFDDPAAAAVPSKPRPLAKTITPASGSDAYHKIAILPATERFAHQSDSDPYPGSRYTYGVQATGCEKSEWSEPLSVQPRFLTHATFPKWQAAYFASEDLTCPSISGPGADPGRDGGSIVFEETEDCITRSASNHSDQTPDPGSPPEVGAGGPE